MISNNPNISSSLPSNLVLPENRLITPDLQLPPPTLIDLVLKTYNSYETHRRNNFEKRWSRADKLYLSWVERKNWPGTEIPRSDIGLSYLFDQIETITPQLINNIFLSGEDFFQLSAEQATDPTQARLIQNHLMYRYNKIKLSSTFELIIKQMLMYGIGGLEMFYDPFEPEEIKRFKPLWVDIKEMYFDKAVRSLDIDDCRAIVREKLMTVNDIWKYSQLSNFNPISEEDLVSLAKEPTYNHNTDLDLLQNAFRQVTSPTNEGIIKGDDKMQVLIFSNKYQEAWVVNRRYLLYSAPAKNRFYNYAFAGCFSLPGSLYSWSMSDALSNFHRYGEGLVNAFFDSKALELMPPKYTPSTGTNQSLRNRWFPGMNAVIKDAKDMQIVAPKSFSQSISAELSWLDQQVERKGVPSISMGMPRPGNANRTLGGMQMQNSGGSLKLITISTHLDNYIINPLVEKTLTILKQSLDPNSTLTVRTPNGPMPVSSLILQSPVEVSIENTGRLINKQALAGAYQVLFNVFSNPNLNKDLQDTGKTVDYSELMAIVQDAIGITKRYTPIRFLTEEEKTARQQAEQQAMEQQLQPKIMEQQTRLQMGQMKVQSEQQINSQNYDLELKRLELERLLADDASATKIVELLFKRMIEKAKLEKATEKLSKGQQPEAPNPLDVLMQQLNLTQKSEDIKSTKLDNELKLIMSKLEQQAKVDEIVGNRERALRENTQQIQSNSLNPPTGT